MLGDPRATRTRSFASIFRGFYKWGWLVGIVPLSHSWFFPDDLLETSYLPFYLLLVFFVGVSSWWMIERGSLTVLFIYLFVGWGLSFCLRLAWQLDASPAWLRWGGAPWSGAISLAWMGLWLVACFRGGVFMYFSRCALSGPASSSEEPSGIPMGSDLKGRQ